MGLSNTLSVVFFSITRCSRFRILGRLLLAFLLATGAAQTAWADSMSETIERALAEKLPVKRVEKLKEIGAKLSLSDIPGVLVWATRAKQLRERTVLQQVTLRRWSELDPAPAFEHISALRESRLKIEAIRFCAAKLARLDVEKAAKAAMRVNAGRSRAEAIDVVAGIWATADVHRAMKWAGELPDGFAKESALNTIRFAWVHSDPVSAAKHVQGLPAGDLKNSLLTNVAGEWAALDPPAAIRWASNLTEASEKELALSNVAESWADAEPNAAADFALKLEPAALRQRAVVAVASRWVTQDPRAAAQWIAGASDLEIQKRGFDEVLNLWASVDPADAASWVQSLGAGPTRESALRSYVNAVAVWAPDFGAQIASRLADENERRELVGHSLKRWLELDPSDAERWIKKEKISPQGNDRLSSDEKVQTLAEP